MWWIEKLKVLWQSHHKRMVKIFEIYEKYSLINDWIVLIIEQDWKFLVFITSFLKKNIDNSFQFTSKLRWKTSLQINNEVNNLFGEFIICFENFIAIFHSHWISRKTKMCVKIDWKDKQENDFLGSAVESTQIISLWVKSMKCVNFESARIVM